MSALIAAVNLRNESASPVAPGVSPSPTESGNASAKSSNKATIIIAAVLATVALMGAAIITWIIRRRRRRRSNSASTQKPSVSPFSILPRLRPRGKAAKDALAEPPTAVVQPRIAKNVRAPGRVAPVVAVNPTPQNAVQSPPSNLPTEELVRILNDRLRGHHWDEEEAPPDYA